MTLLEAYAALGAPLILLMIGLGALWWVRRTTPDPEIPAYRLSTGANRQKPAAEKVDGHEAVT